MPGMLRGKDEQLNLDEAMIEQCNEVGALQRMLEVLKKLVASLFLSPSLARNEPAVLFDLAQNAGLADSQAESDVLASLAVNVASKEGLEVSGNPDNQTWITQPFPVQTILAEAIVLQRETEGKHVNKSHQYSKSQKRQEKLQQNDARKRMRFEDGLTKTKARMVVDPEQRDFELAKRNVRNRAVKGVNNPTKLRAADGVHQTKARFCIKP